MGLGALSVGALMLPYSISTDPDNNALITSIPHLGLGLGLSLSTAYLALLGSGTGHAADDGPHALRFLWRIPFITSPVIAALVGYSIEAGLSLPEFETYMQDHPHREDTMICAQVRKWRGALGCEERSSVRKSPLDPFSCFDRHSASTSGTS